MRTLNNPVTPLKGKGGVGQVPIQPSLANLFPVFPVLPVHMGEARCNKARNVGGAVF